MFMDYVSFIFWHLVSWESVMKLLTFGFHEGASFCGYVLCNVVAYIVLRSQYWLCKFCFNYASCFIWNM